MLARIIKTELIERPKYKAYKVTFRNLDTGKPLSTNVVNFGDQASVFEAIAKAKTDDVFAVTVKRSDDGKFYNWVGIEPAEAPPEEAGKEAVGEAKGRGRAVDRDWETRQERALRQILIVRQSSLSAAQAFGKEYKSVDDLFAVAEKIEGWVFRSLKTPDGAPVSVEDAMKELLSMKDDIPA